MNINLTIKDIDTFLEKYTRFITKNIYISNKMYTRFFSDYEYLFKTLEKEKYLYSDNQKYKQIENILRNKTKLIKLHNKKYLQTSLKKHQSFFDKLNITDSKIKYLILLEEENTYIVNLKKEEQFIIGKLNFLLENKKILPEDILIITTTSNKQLKKECQNLNVTINDLEYYSNTLLLEKVLLNDSKKSTILIKYLINELYSNKDRFNSLYKAFSKYIYLNKDYKEYETFNDYHNYLYKRKYLSSGLSLKKFNKEEIKRRRTYLRTIQNEIMNSKEEVDIANFLYLNSITYIYDKDNFLFKIKLSDKENYIRYIAQKELLTIKNTYIDNTIYLYSSYTEKKTYLEVLAYELIKRRYPLELISEEEVYNRLKDTNIDNYFSEFVNKYLIPLINHYEEYQNLEDTKLNYNQQEEFLKLYEDYLLLTKNHITNKNLYNKIEEELNNQKYKYLILLGDIPLHSNMNTIKINNNYQENKLLKENIKLLYDYKKYIIENQILPIPNTYVNKTELNTLTTIFLKENLNIINNYIKETKKEIELIEYNDDNRLHIYKNIAQSCHDFIKNNSKNTLVALNKPSDINILIDHNYFTKLNKKTLSTGKIKIEVEEILKINNTYDNILIPYLIKDDYHEDLLNNNYRYNLKLMLYVTLTKCRKKIIILYPKSKKQLTKELISKLI